MPVIAPDLNASSNPPARLREAACAVRTFARTETCMPINPVNPERTAPMKKPIAAVIDSKYQTARKTTTPTRAIVEYCRVR
ncbi:hypothetical protein D9M69_492780 [compost metagenome]